MLALKCSENNYLEIKSCYLYRHIRNVDRIKKLNIGLR